MITPNQAEQLKNEKYNYDKLESEIDESIKRHSGFYPYETASLMDELPVDVRNNIAKRYYDAGWNYIYHRTSGENNEKPGITTFIFSQTPVTFTSSNYIQYKGEPRPTEELLEPNKKYILPIADGQLELTVSNDPLYPGVDIEFVMPDESQDYITKPRIVIEAPIDEDTKIQENLRVLLWAGAYTEDFTNKVVFTNRQLCKNQRTKLSFTDDIGYTEFQVYTEWLEVHSSNDPATIFHLAAEDPDVSGLIC